MKYITFIAAIGACMLAGCVDMHSIDVGTCNQYGFQPGTDAFARCMMKLDERHSQDIDNALVEPKQAAPARIIALPAGKSLPSCRMHDKDVHLDMDGYWSGPNCTPSR